MSDFHLANHGSVVVLTPLTMAADEWVMENVQTDMVWAKGIVISASSASNILAGLVRDGLTVND